MALGFDYARAVEKFDEKKFKDLCRRLVSLFESAVETQELSAQEMAARVGYSRATFYNKLKRPEGIKLWELARMAHGLGFSLRFPVAKSGLSDPDRMTSGEQRGGLDLTDDQAAIVSWMRELTPKQQAEVRKNVWEYMSLRGFPSPGAEGAADARHDKKS